MKTNKKLFVLFSLAILCVGLTGCASKSIESLGGGYEEVTYTQPSIFMEQDAHQFALEYSPGKDKWRIKIWPDTFTVRIKNDVAVFIAHKAYEPPSPEEPRATNPRLFAVRSPDMPLDITDEVLWRCAKQSKDPQLLASPVKGNMAELLKNPDLLKKTYIGIIEQTNGMLKFYFSIRDTGPSGTIHLDWNQIPDIMREVREKGVVRKDRVCGAKYLEKEFKPEVQK